jgi:hypothetical protein
VPVGANDITLVVTDDGGAQNIDTVLVTVNGYINQPPTAAAGPDQTLTDGDNNGVEPVTLDGSGSTDADGTIVAYSWMLNAVEIATGVNPTVNVPVGANDITLVVTDDGGAVAFDNVLVTVNAGGAARVTSNLIALYDFEEGGGAAVNDVSGYGSPLNLSIRDTAATSWGAGTLTINSPTFVESGIPASKINNAIMASGAFTSEAWIAAANDTQNGPARIVTLSEDVDDRNYTLGQGVGRTDPTAIQARLEIDPVSGYQIRINAPVGTIVPGQLLHVVYTRTADGTSTMYVNGTPVASGVAAGSLANWDPNYTLTLANEPGWSQRPWLGAFHLVAFYDRALSGAEVGQNFNAGPQDG